MYEQSSETIVLMGLGAAGDQWAVLDRINGTGLTDTEPQTPTADASMSRLAKAAAAQRVAGGGPYTARYDFVPGDATAAFEELERLRGTTTLRKFREEQGEPRTVFDGSGGDLTVAVAKSDKKQATLTFAGTEVPADIRDSDLDSNQVVVVGAQGFMIEMFTGAKTAIGSLLGAYAGGVVTPNTDLVAAAMPAANANVYEYATRRDFSAQLNSLTPSATAQSRTSALILGLDKVWRRSYVVLEANLTNPTVA